MRKDNNQNNFTFSMHLMDMYYWSLVFCVSVEGICKRMEWSKKKIRSVWIYNENKWWVVKKYINFFWNCRKSFFNDGDKYWTLILLNRAEKNENEEVFFLLSASVLWRTLSVL